MAYQLFPLGRCVVTANALAKLTGEVGIEECPRIMENLLGRHSSGDWGDLDSEDIAQNERSVKDGERILSSYKVEDLGLWVITERDRSVTTVLLPEDY